MPQKPTDKYDAAIDDLLDGDLYSVISAIEERCLPRSEAAARRCDWAMQNNWQNLGTALGGFLAGWDDDEDDEDS